ncbi:MAG: hypothetical protein WDZ35_06315 [Crocinitomicaceae bacterium]
MKRIVYISFVIALIIGISSCEKEEIKPFFTKDQTTSDGGDCFHNNGTKGSTDIPTTDFDGVKDPDEDPDFDEDGNIVDPDEDEDFEEEEDGK